jgi:hypothetical protein
MGIFVFPGHGNTLKKWMCFLAGTKNLIFCPKLSRNRYPFYAPTLFTLLLFVSTFLCAFRRPRGLYAVAVCVPMPAFTGRASGLPLVARARPFTQGTARPGLPLPSRAERPADSHISYSLFLVFISPFRPYRALVRWCVP